MHEKNCVSSTIQTILSVPEFTKRVTGSAACAGRGLYRRWGITPRPEEQISNIIQYNHNFCIWQAVFTETERGYQFY